MIRFDELSPGPGSYNISLNLATRSSVYQNSPRSCIQKGKKLPNIYISSIHSKGKLSSNSPSSTNYTPNMNFILETPTSVRFTSTPRFDNFLTAANRSPGPIYTLPKLPSASIKIGTEGLKPKAASKSAKGIRYSKAASSHRMLFEKKEITPGPGSYGSIYLHPTKANGSFSKGKRNIDVRTCKQHIVKKAKEYLMNA